MVEAMLVFANQLMREGKNSVVSRVDLGFFANELLPNLPMFIRVFEESQTGHFSLAKNESSWTQK